ncbi:hypothetical protein, partial [Bacillus sp. SN10]|uniref:hypothetical protein n=1 Tax=Bacillus sp. SN10 TaxID=2056493 RepID=UPI000CB1DA7D
RIKMKYQKKIYPNVKFPSLIIDRILKDFRNSYKNGQFKLHMYKTTHGIYRYEDLNSFFSAYDQSNNVRFKIEYLVLNVPYIEIEYNKQYTSIYMLYISNYDFNTLINPLEEYIKFK